MEGRWSMLRDLEKSNPRENMVQRKVSFVTVRNSRTGVTLSEERITYMGHLLHRLSFLSSCGKQIFETLVKVLHTDRFGLSPAFRCLEYLWRLEDLYPVTAGESASVHKKSSSCIQLLFQEALAIFRYNSSHASNQQMAALLSADDWAEQL